MTAPATFDLDRLDPNYATILCDLWGVVHDGTRLFDGVAERLLGWAREGRTIVLITNAPRAASTVRSQLDRLGLPRSAYSAISTGGQAGIDALRQLGAPSGFVGTRLDRLQMEEAGLRFVDRGFCDLACIGLDDERRSVADYIEQLEACAAAEVVMHCLNPDRIVVHGGRPEICAGALADAYEALGGQVRWYGKPFPAIYEHAIAQAGNPPCETILTIGDGFQTDVLGAARQGLDLLFVSGGIHAGEPFPPDFAILNGLGDWQPVGIVDGIGQASSATRA